MEENNNELFNMLGRKSHQKWEMIKEEDNNNFSMNLLRNPDVNKHSIFIVPCTGFMGGIWLWKFTHKNSRVDFWHFYEEYGTEYQKPEEKPENKPILKELHEKNSEDTKYGWISPDGKYFHCGYQGHANLADEICFGMIDTSNAEHYLEEHGWCKIYKSMFEDNYRKRSIASTFCNQLSSAIIVSHYTQSKKFST